MKVTIAVAWLAVSASLFIGDATAAPTAFQLVFDGHHVVADFPTPTGLAHVGTFTTNSPLCPSGHARDIAENDQGVSTRLFTCDGSDSTFTATISYNFNEHGGEGSWQITGGSGPLTDLRGKGAFSSVLVAGNPSDFQSVVFRSTWHGVVDLYATPPSVQLTQSRVRKLRQRNRYLVQLRLSIADQEGAVAYTLQLTDPRGPGEPLVRSSAQATNGSIARTYDVHTKPTTRALRLTITASDPIGNTTTLDTNIKLTVRATAVVRSSRRRCSSKSRQRTCTPGSAPILLPPEMVSGGLS